jgi:hypothetical protein
MRRLDANAHALLKMLLIVWLELREEVGTSLEAINVYVLTEVKVLAGIAAGQLNAHHILVGRKMRVGLAVIRDLPTCFACLTPATVPHKECSWVFLRKCGRRTRYRAANVGNQNESRNKQSDKGTTRRPVVTPPGTTPCRGSARVHKKCNKADSDKQNPQNLKEGHFGMEGTVGRNGGRRDTNRKYKNTFIQFFLKIE